MSDAIFIIIFFIFIFITFAYKSKETDAQVDENEDENIDAAWKKIQELKSEVRKSQNSDELFKPVVILEQKEIYDDNLQDSSDLEVAQENQSDNAHLKTNTHYTPPKNQKITLEDAYEIEGSASNTYADIQQQLANAYAQLNESSRLAEEAFSRSKSNSVDFPDDSLQGDICNQDGFAETNVDENITFVRSNLGFSSLRQAIVASEIIRPPLALRNSKFY